MHRLSLRAFIHLMILGILCGRAVADAGDNGKVDAVNKGVARRIGKSFHKKQTASGEPHDYKALVAAHKTLPFGACVRVTNLANEKTVVARINDRIPTGDDSLIRVSWRAAETLGMLEQTEATIKRLDSETGVASWVGAEYHGRETASGEIYDMDSLTAAHNYLPFGARVRVVNLDNNKSVVVRINDRGPFAKGRIIDVSRKAAIELGLLIKGSARVRVEILLEIGG
jgi:rare lipoprotein A